MNEVSTPVPAPARPADLGLRLAVQELIEEIRPAIQMDGGDVAFVDLDETGKVTVRLSGACTGCAMSQLTLKQGIENLLVSRLDGVTSVEAETEPATEPAPDGAHG
jgi:Fe-S cluster biogenesis protein NfuA